MKKFPIQIIAILFLAVSCQKGNAQPGSHSAAQQIYQQYADIEGLTVALVENYATKGDTINAVMIQAQNPDAWLRLLSDFSGYQAQPPAPNAKTSYLSVARINADTTLRSDTLRGDINEYFNTKIQEMVTEELLNEKVQEFMPSMSNCDSLLLNALKSVQTHFDTNIVHFDTSFAMTNSQTWVNGQKVSDITTTADPAALIQHNRHLINAALDGQENGYIVHAESDEMTLWLFFYSSQAQHDAILDRISNN